MPSPNAKVPKVFISYSHDSHVQLDRVLALADRLRAEGIDCNLDQYESTQPQRWPSWMNEQFRAADFILVVCTEIYCRRFEGREESGKGMGAKWEGAIITSELYRDETLNRRFIPIIFAAEDAAQVPEQLRDYTRYLVTDEQGYEALYRRLTKQPRVVKPPLGQVQTFEPVNKLNALPDENRQQEFPVIEAEVAHPSSHQSVATLTPSLVTEPVRAPVKEPETPWQEQHDKVEVKNPTRQLAPLSSRRRRLILASGVLVMGLAIAVASSLLYKSNSVVTDNRSPTPTVASPSPVAKATLRSFTADLGNGVKLEIVALPGGTFEMGSDNGTIDEKPKHKVTLSPFAIGKYEVTQAQWQAVMGNNPSYFKGDNLPVERVSWLNVQKFIERLKLKTGNQTYCLPTEAEWEYAARAGSTGKYSFGDDAAKLGEYAWFRGNSGAKTHPVGLKKPNDWGLYDMQGNVSEWCQDWYSKDYYEQSVNSTNPRGPSSGEYRVLRGGPWFINIDDARPVYRGFYNPGDRDISVGFRVVVARSPS